MALYLKKQEIVHRICNGYITHDGYVDGKPYNIYKANDIPFCELRYEKILKCFMDILDSMDGEGVEIYPKDLRGARIQEIRKKQGKSGAWVASKAGLSKTTVYSIEKGLKVPRLSTLTKIAEVLHVTLDELG